MILSELLAKAAPWLAAAAAGPAGLAAQAIRSVAGAVGARSEAIDDIASAVAGATPEQLAALKIAENDFRSRMAELGFRNIEEMERIAASDRDSARNREIKSLDSWTPRALAFGITLGFFAALAQMLLEGLPAGNNEVLFVMLGSLGTAWTGVIAYYFGTTAGSVRKTEFMAQGASKGSS